MEVVHWAWIFMIEYRMNQLHDVGLLIRLDMCNHRVMDGISLCYWLAICIDFARV